ncbi:GlsB/YeaQ/YmgE family stress response membrane protein [Lichenibacterium minor]|uniref:GlsB/YeaQ/YmgE family stress response membrane protein n=1 Tax=Lichenibacterium minor TaxID=2316528 RepID=A0A4Q2U8M1_9HYPH|nr:GlsB/YeaQ/YmgE family stress response membrane protein [Lichenibacterium minor]RYC31491.1 GlsB/YeaQ/YmgE family stress response membrane protein [Lichenibacterium minor]
MLLDSLHTTNIVAVLLIGLVAGWLASLVVGGGGLWRDLVTGLVGAVVGAFVLRALGVVLPFHDPLVADIVTATIGAVIVVVVARAVA